MPSKKKPTEPTGDLVVEIREDDDGQPGELLEVVASHLCGHINRHSLGLDKKPDNVACDKPKGHGGDHSGIHQEYFKEYETKVVNGQEVTTILLVPQDRRVEWGDMAGIPLSQIPRPQPPAPPTVANLERRLRALENKSLPDGEFINK